MNLELWRTKGNSKLLTKLL